MTDADLLHYVYTTDYRVIRFVAMGSRLAAAAAAATAVE